MALFSGGALGVAGMLLQKVTRNNLADISLLGIGSINIIFITAYVLVFKNQVFGHGIIASMLPVVTLFASLLGTLIVWFFSRSKKANSQKFIIVGIALQLLFEGLAVVLIDPSKTIKPDMAKTMGIIKDYSVGMIEPGAVKWWLIIVSSTTIGVAMAIVLSLRKKIDLIEANEDLAKALGVKVELMKFIVYFIVAALAAAEAVKVGAVSLLGLIAPAIARMLFKNKTGLLMAGSFIIGGLMVMGAAIISITIGTQLPVGIMATTIVIPYFIYIIIRSK